jgi:deoxyribodipyrimidine photolyase-related protein
MRLIWILGDQLLPDSPLLTTPSGDTVVGLIESAARGRQLRYHQQKLTLIYAAMRHYADALRRAGHRVLYHRLEDAPEGGDFATVLDAWVRRHALAEIHLLDPNAYDTTCCLPALERQLGVPIHTHRSNQFLVGREEFGQWARGRKRLLMESHYRHLRRRTGILMDAAGGPQGGVWNLDAENRRTARQFHQQKPLVPLLPELGSDPVVQEVATQVARRFTDHPGRAADLWLPARRDGARQWLQRFISERLQGFGPWEDVMVVGQKVLFHSVLSPMLNIGLLTPRECLEAAQEAHRQGTASLASVEGFIRQILGWREFIHGIYWLKMPAYREENALKAHRALPRWAYDGSTEMACVAEAIRNALRHGYNHHIQRLMVLGNYFLLGGYSPGQVLRWYSELYIDAYDWVMVPNVLGMILYADGGLFATKPYTAGAAYLSKMGDHCKGCRYNPKIREGDDACPFHALYWNFYGLHVDILRSNPRIGMMVRLWEKKSAQEKVQIRKTAERFLDAQA